MNKKIKELAAQAEEYMEIPMPDDVYHMGDGVFRRHKTFNREKFAELIVKECVDILEPKSRYMGEGPEVLKDKISQIKKHFGVEP